MMQHICQEFPELDEKESFIGCFAHVLNLAVKAIFKSLGSKTAKSTLKQIEKDINNNNGTLDSINYSSTIEKVLIFQFHISFSLI
jgi:hypothetical protein